MAIVLAGFLGRWVYNPTIYKFSGEEEESGAHTQQAKLFPLALQRYLAAKSDPVKIDKWLIMGTKDSRWSALEEALGAWDDNCLDIRVRLDESANQGDTSQELLDEWSRILTQQTGLPTRCYLTDTAENDRGQQAIWQALSQIIEPNDELVFDITYGLRHQPVVAAFSLMLLRWSHQVEKISLYYGAAELKKNAKDATEFCPVVRLDFCERLTKACEAISNVKQTGHYELLGKELGMGASFEQDLESLVFSDEVNRPQRDVARALCKRVEKKKAQLEAPTEVLVPRLVTALDWAANEKTHEQFRKKAIDAHALGQNFKAVAYLYEAVLMAWMFVDNSSLTGRDYITYGKRNRAKKALEEATNYSDATRHVIFMRLSYLRNGVLHGTRSTHPDYNVEDCITDVDKFNEFFKDGIQLYDEVLNGNL